jgi:uncharacterized alkaline shock family protein YloU
MKALKTLTLIVYMVILIVIGVALVAVAFGLISMAEVNNTIDYLATIKNAKLVTGLVGGLLILVSFLILHASLGKIQREKTIAFSNPDGRVSISLSAIEDFIKRTAKQIPEVKDLKSDVVASKRGIEISTKVSLLSDTNIPETTEKIQTSVKSRLQEMLGIEEAIFVAVNVVKIVHKEDSSGAQKKKPEQQSTFKGIQYRAD